MSKLLRSVTARYSSRSDVTTSTANRPQGSDDGACGTSAPSSFRSRILRKLPISKLGSRSRASICSQNGNNPVQGGESGPAVGETSWTLLGRMRVMYERAMVKMASKSGEFTAVPAAKAARAPPALSSALSPTTEPLSCESRVGTKISDLDPGFKMTAVEKKYLEHLTRSASARTF